MSLFELGEKLSVWSRGHEMPGYDPNVWRTDDFGSVIKFEEYGDRSARYGWEIDHIHPTALGGLNSLGNKRPLHCRNNSGLGGLLGNALKGNGLSR